MSVIANAIEAYRQGRTPLVELVEWLAHHDFRSRRQPAPGKPYEYPQAGTWDEVQVARLLGMLAPEEYVLIERRRRQVREGVGDVEAVRR
jgi:hypothetical protein